MTYKDSGSEITHHSWLYAMYAPDKKFMALQRVSEVQSGNRQSGGGKGHKSFPL